MKICKVLGCGRKHHGHGYCHSHWQRRYKNLNIPLDSPLRKPGQRIIKPFIERFWEKVDVRGPNECWPWVGYRDTGGYGVINVDGRPRGAHRVSYELHFGSIPEDKQINHSCYHSWCENPNHIYAGTKRDNWLDYLDEKASTARAA